VAVSPKILLSVYGKKRVAKFSGDTPPPRILDCPLNRPWLGTKHERDSLRKIKPGVTIMPASETKIDIFTRVTSQIIAALEEGVRPWVKPWKTEAINRPLRSNGKPYTGINVLLLWMASCATGYTSDRWMTYKQADELGGQVRKGEKGTGIVYANSFTKKETAEDGEEFQQEIYFLKGYTVFNVEQITDLPPEYYSRPAPRPEPAERIEKAEKFFATIPAVVHHGGNRAYYSDSGDYIQLPSFEAFRDAESYYATKGHELVHWTSHENRLNRDFGRKKWGDEGYAKEELVAEIGASFLCADIGLTPAIREDHAPYIKSWLKVLKDDKRAIFKAAAHAQKAFDYLKQFSGEPS
jgi:antirestriction protein ArdC